MLRVQSDLGLYCLQYRLHKQKRGADDNSCDWGRGVGGAYTLNHLLRDNSDKISRIIFSIN